jgi:hypothetical protein
VGLKRFVVSRAHLKLAGESIGRQASILGRG